MDRPHGNLLLQKEKFGRLDSGRRKSFHSSLFTIFVSTDKNYHEQCLYGFPRCTAYEPFRVDDSAVKLNLFLVKTISFGTKEQCHTGGRHFIDEISDDMLRWIKSKTWRLFNQ